MHWSYRMRANSPRRHTIAMLIVVAIAIVGFTIPTLLKLATPEQKEVMTEVTTLSKLAEPEKKTGRNRQKINRVLRYAYGFDPL